MESLVKKTHTPEITQINRESLMNATKISVKEKMSWNKNVENGQKIEFFVRHSFNENVQSIRI